MIIKTNKQSILKILNGKTIGLLTLMKEIFNDGIINITITNEFVLQIESLDDYLYPMLIFLKKHTLCLFNILIDIAAYELLGTTYRFILVYNLLSYKFSERLFLKIKTPEISNRLQSITSLFKNSN